MSLFEKRIERYNIDINKIYILHMYLEFIPRTSTSSTSPKDNNEHHNKVISDKNGSAGNLLLT